MHLLVCDTEWIQISHFDEEAQDTGQLMVIETGLKIGDRATGTQSQTGVRDFLPFASAETGSGTKWEPFPLGYSGRNMGTPFASK